MAATALVVASLGAGLSGCKLPVPIGGGRNFLGTYNLSGLGITQPENSWLSVGGACMRREYGDLVIAQADNNGGGAGTSAGAMDDTPDSSCIVPAAGGPPYVRPNPGHDAGGYRYRISIPDAATGPHHVQIYDPGMCASSSADGSANSSQTTTFTLLAPDGTTAATRTWQKDGVGGAVACGATGVNGVNSWYTLTTVTNPGDYILRVSSPPVTVNTTTHQNNQFSLRVFAGTWRACTGDPAQAGGGVVHDPTCPSISALGPIGLYLNLTSGTPTFRIGPTPPGSDGHTFDVELFDAAETMSTVELLDPLGQPALVTPEVGCQDGTYATDTGIDCPAATGETPPTANGGLTYGPWSPRTAFDICGPKPKCGHGYGTVDDAAAQPWGFAHSIQRTQYSNRTIRLRTTLPADLAAAYGPNTIWSLRYTRAGTTGTATDRITMTATVS